MPYYGDWITDTHAISLTDTGRTGELFAWSACYASDTGLLADGYNHPYGGGQGGGSLVVGAGVTGDSHYPTNPRTAAWSTGSIGYTELHPEMESWSPSSLSGALTPPLPAGAVSVQMDPAYPVLDHYLVRLGSDALVAHRQVTQQPFADEVVLENIVDPDPDGAYAGLTLRAFLLSSSAGMPTAAGDEPLSWTPDAAVVAAAPPFELSTVAGYMNKSASYDSARAVALAHTPFADLSRSSAQSVDITVPPPAGGAPIRLLLADSTALDRTPYEHISFPDWSRSAIATDTPVSVFRQVWPTTTSIEVLWAPVFIRRYRFLYTAPAMFPMTVTTRARGKIVPPLHVPKPGPVPDGVLTPEPPIPPSPPVGSWFATEWNSLLPTGDGFFYNGFYNGTWLRLFHTTLLTDLTAGLTMFWRGPADAPDNRTDGTGFFLEIDLFEGRPGDPSHGDYGHYTGSQPWDHNDRYRTWAGTPSGGPPRDKWVQEFVPAGADIWLLAQQWPDGHYTPLPLDPYVAWNPKADMGSFFDADSNPLPMPWHMADLVEVPVPVPSSLWGP